MTFLDIEKLEQDRTDLIEVINSYRSQHAGPHDNDANRRYLSFHLERLEQLDADISERRHTRWARRSRILMSAA